MRYFTGVEEGGFVMLLANSEVCKIGECGGVGGGVGKAVGRGIRALYDVLSLFGVARPVVLAELVDDVMLRRLVCTTCIGGLRGSGSGYRRGV